MWQRTGGGKEKWNLSIKMLSPCHLGQLKEPSGVQGRLQGGCVLSTGVLACKAPGDAGFIYAARVVTRRSSSSKKTTARHLPTEPLFREAQKGSPPSVIALP